MSRPISIEVFKDTETPCVDPSIALPAIKYVSDLTGGSLQFVDGSKELQVSRRRHMPTVTPYDTHHLVGNSSADIMLILTERNIVMETIEHPIGYSERDPKKSGGVAVVSTYRTSPEIATFTVAHELGHLYGLSYGEGAHSHHCDDDTCLMHSSTSYREYQSENTVHLSMENQAFCTPCGQQLGRRALFMLRHRNNLYVPERMR